MYIILMGTCKIFSQRIDFTNKVWMKTNFRKKIQSDLEFSLKKTAVFQKLEFFQKKFNSRPNVMTEFYEI